MSSREYLQNLTADQPLLKCENVRKASAKLDKQAAEIEEHIAACKDDARIVGPISASKAEEFLKKRSKINMLSADYCRDARKLLEDDDLPFTDAETCKRQFSEIADLEDTVMKERALILGNNDKLGSSMTYHANYVSLGEAYMYSVVENLPLTDGARLQYSSSKPRFSRDQIHFKKNLETAYGALKDMKQLGAWCPVLGMVDAKNMVGAHIVPQSVGELNAAYLFAADDPDEGHGKLWGLENGVYLYYTVENAMDAGRIVFVPGSEPGEIRVLVLDRDLLHEEVMFRGPTWAEVDNKLLTFRTGVRPGLRAIYIHALISVLRRKLYNCKNWQYDVKRVFHDRIWYNIKGQQLKKSTVLALVAELGDLSEEMIEQLDLERSGLVDSGGKPIETLDKARAKIIRGFWTSQDEFEPWYQLREEIEEEQELAALER